MQSKLDVFDVYPRQKLSTSPGFQVKGGSDVQFFCTSDPPVRPTPLRLVFMTLSCTPYMIFAESTYDIICSTYKPLKINYTCHLPPELTMIYLSSF